MDLYSHRTITERITQITVPGQVYVYLACGTERAALIDTGCGVSGLRDYIGRLTDKPLSVILTHGHFDHAGGIGEFENVYMAREDLELVKRHNSQTIRGSRLLSLPGIRENMIVPPMPRGSFRPLYDGQRFDLGGVELILRALPGHTAGSFCVEFNGEDALLLGDACNSAMYLQLPESLPVEAYLRALQDFRQRLGPFSGRCLYSHPHNYGDLRILAEMEELCGEIMKEAVGEDVPGLFGNPARMAKPVDGKRRRLDGKIANLIYCPDRIRREDI